MFKWVQLGVVLFFLVGTISHLRSYLAFRRRAVKVPARVVDLARAAGANGKTDYHPILEFTTVEGDSVRASTNLGANPPPARPPKRVTAAYDPQDPQQIDILKYQWLSTFFALFGPLFSVVGLILVGASIFVDAF